MKTNFTPMLIAKKDNKLREEKVTSKLIPLSIIKLALGIMGRSQFAVEKLNKAALNLLGVKIEKTHTPIKILNSIILDEKTLDNDESTKENLLNIISYSGLFEDEGVKSRYGISKEEILMIPEQIYTSFENIRQFILNLQKIVDLYLILWNETFNINEIEFKELKELKKLNKKLKKWI